MEFYPARSSWRVLTVSVRPSFCESRNMSMAIRLWIFFWVRIR
jgi:hypothetical protein